MSKVCQVGHRLILDEDGSYIQDKAIGEWTPSGQGVYKMKWCVAPESAGVSKLGKNDAQHYCKTQHLEGHGVDGSAE